ncbi:MAG TPA: LptA/OstA family protein [Polyangiaceae bacterium]
MSLWSLRRRCLGVCVACTALCSGGGTPAAPAARLLELEGRELSVRADQLEIDVAREVMVLRGNVQARLGELLLSCPTVEARYDADAHLKSARCSAGATAKMKGFSATAQTVDIDVLRRRLRLDGQVRVVRGGGWLHAETAEVDLVTGRVSLNQVRGSIPLESPAK